MKFALAFICPILMRLGISWDYKSEQKFMANKLGGYEGFFSGLELSWRGGPVLPRQWEMYLEGQRCLVLLNILGMQH